MENITKKMTIQLQPYSLTELAALYNVTPRTLKLWLEPFLEPIGLKKGRFYTIRQIEVIFEKIGEPGKELAA